MDDPSMVLWIILICLLFSAFFSGIEISFISSDKLHFELLRQKGTLRGRILSKFHENSTHFLATTLVGNNLALVVYGIFMAKLIEPFLVVSLPPILQDPIVVLIFQSLISTLIVLITAEFIPKSIFLLNPDFMLTMFAIPMGLIYVLMYPVVWLITLISKFVITRILRLEFSSDKPVFGLVDLNNYIKKNVLHIAKDKDPEIDPKIFNNAIEFKDVKVRECMIHRTEIIGVDVNDSIETLKEAFITSGHSKIVIFRDTIDDVIGYCHSLEMFKKPESIKSILTPIIIVPGTMLANELLIQFINQRKSLALVVDEFGGTSGIVSMEDVIEEIFGEIRDEHDEEALLEEQIDELNFLLSARHEIDYLNDKYNWNLPEGEYDTLGGLILEENEDIPQENDVIEIDTFRFEIMSMEEKRINQVKLTLDKTEETV